VSTSQNGWLVLDKTVGGPQPTLREWNIPGVDRTIPLRDGSAGFLLIHMATWFDRNIERIDMGFDDWGWSTRKIAGTDQWSNHASGTAMDLNSNEHPQGSPPSATFSTIEVNGIHRRLKMYKECVRWGGDFRTIVDTMHYEINQDLPACEARARYLCGRGTIGRQILKANPGARDVIFS
jgi:hypothetical protein